MGSRKIKRERKGSPKLRGHRQQRWARANERAQAQRAMQEQARRRRLTKIDVVTGETYILSRLALKDKSNVQSYKDGLAAAVQETEESAEAQAEAIRCYIQKSIDEGLLVPFACARGERPSCRVYQGDNRRVTAIRHDDPDAEVWK